MPNKPTKFAHLEHEDRMLGVRDGARRSTAFERLMEDVVQRKDPAVRNAIQKAVDKKIGEK